VNTTQPLSVSIAWTDPVGVITASGVEDSRNSVLVNNLDLKFSKMMLFIIHGNWM
jgi:hypothetical protein